MEPNLATALASQVCTGIVDNGVDAIRMLLFQKCSKILDRLGLGDVKLAKLDLSITAILAEYLCLLKLRIIGQICHCFGASGARSFARAALGFLGP